MAALLTAVTLCALGSYCGERFRLAAGILYPALCCLNGAFLPFLPALTYDGFSGRRRLLYGCGWRRCCSGWEPSRRP